MPVPDVKDGATPPRRDAGGWLGRRARDIVAAWQAVNVRRGFIATLLIAVGALSPAYLPRNSPWWRLLDALNATGTAARVAGTLVTIGGLLLLIDSWFRLRPSPRPLAAAQHVYHDVKHWAILLIWGAPFVLAPPIFSHDAYSYAAQGWLIHNGINPYDAGPSVLPGPFNDQVAWVWRNTPAPYGPLSLQLQHLLVEISRFDPYLAALLQRIPALVGVVLIVLLVPRVARRIGADAAFAAWFATLNPVLVIDFVGGAHNDALMMGLVILAVWVAGWPPSTRLGRWRIGAYWWLVAAALVGVGAAIKQPAFLAAYVLALIPRPWRDFSARETAITALRVAISFALAVGVFALVSLATGLGFGWINAVNVPGLVVTIAPFMVLGQLVQVVLNLLHLDPSGHEAIRLSRSIGLVVAGLLISYLAVTEARRRPHSFLSKAYLTVAFCAPALRSWYLLWGGSILPWVKPRTRLVNVAIWASLVFLCYDGIAMAWRNDSLAFGVALTGGVWWLARSEQRGRITRLGGGNRRKHIPASAAHVELGKADHDA